MFKQLILSLKDVLEIWIGGVGLTEYLIWNHLVVIKNTLHGVKGDHFDAAQF